MMKILIVFLSFLLISCKGEKPHVVSVLVDVDNSRFSIEAINSWMIDYGFEPAGNTSNKLNNVEVYVQNYSSVNLKAGYTYMQPSNMLDFSFISNSNSGDLSSNEIILLNNYCKLVKNWLTSDSNVQFIGFIANELYPNCRKLIET